MSKTKTPLAKRFWPKVEIGAVGKCWEWMAAKQHDGYGVLGNEVGSQTGAHRIAWQLCRGSISLGMCVCHHCDNPGCVNPSHLFLGTHADNMHDMFAKGRRIAAHGEQAGSAKLTAEQVRAIRREYASGIVTQAALGKRYGVSQPSISLIISKKHWRES